MKGIEWSENGYWDYVPEQAGLFLEQIAGDGYNRKHDWHYRTCTFEEFKNMHFDIFLASIFPNEFAMMRLRDNLSPDTKVIRQNGNPSETCFDNSCRNFIMTITPTDQYMIDLTKNLVEAKRNWCYVHQEFDMENHYKYTEPSNFKKINAYQNGLIYSSFHHLWLEMKELLPEFEFNMYGCLSDSGIGFDVATELAGSMADAGFIWQTKANEDGGGFLSHNALAVGRPLICKKSNYGGVMLDMLIDGETCIDLDARTMPENAEFIRECSKPEKLAWMSKRCNEIYRQYVDFEKDAQIVNKFLKELQ